jgi:hypothetical protein
VSSTSAALIDGSIVYGLAAHSNGLSGLLRAREEQREQNRGYPPSPTPPKRLLESSPNVVVAAR